MTNVTIYTTRYCGYCMRAKQLLSSKHIAFNEIATDGDSRLRAELTKKAGSQTVPQIWIGDTHIGGCDELFQLERQKKLDVLLNPGQ